MDTRLTGPAADDDAGDEVPWIYMELGLGRMTSSASQARR